MTVILLLMNKPLTNVVPAGYRPNVGMVLINQQHQILAGETIHYPGEWMMPQGGIDSGESPAQAMQRELVEETSITIDQVRLLQEASNWISYQFRKPMVKEDTLYIGQHQKWFLLEYNGSIPNADETIDREFSQFKWVDSDWLVENTSPFKADVYLKILAEFGPGFP